MAFNGKTISFNGKEIKLKKDGSVNLTYLSKELRIKYKEALDRKKEKQDEEDLKKLLDLLD